MAKKPTTKFICNVCGAIYSAWAGKCTACGEWNTLEEHQTVSRSSAAGSSRAAKAVVQTLRDVTTHTTLDRLSTGIKELDVVLGGGFVAGEVVLVAGEPGIGKSTLLLQIAAAASGSGSVLYVSAEESAQQVGLRAQRLGLADSGVLIASENDTAAIVAWVQSGDYRMVIVDSIQTISLNEIATSQGSVSQITNSAYLLHDAAKQSNTIVIMVGHVTKEGSIAGPKVLEHTVDAVCSIEGDRFGGFKMIRAAKNRFGATGEVALFTMDEKGLLPVPNPSEALLAERRLSDGSVVTAHIEGSRPLLVEIQALVQASNFGYPKRTASGFDVNRMNLLLAMLEKRTSLSFADKDVYLNVVGGIRLQEPAADLAVVMAIASASRGLQLKRNVVVFGELGLSGEVRHVPYAERRLQEARKLGFDGALCPHSTKKTVGAYPVKTVREALNAYLEKGN